MADETKMTTYRRADGRLLGGEWSFATDIESCEAEGEWSDVPIEYVEEKWMRVAVRRFVLPVCNGIGCDAPATFWGLCEKHAREDDPTAFDRHEVTP
jgi:hypothetical protein